MSCLLHWIKWSWLSFSSSLSSLFLLNFSRVAYYISWGRERREEKNNVLTFIIFDLVLFFSFSITKQVTRDEGIRSEVGHMKRFTSLAGVVHTETPTQPPVMSKLPWGINDHSLDKWSFFGHWGLHRRSSQKRVTHTLSSLLQCNSSSCNVCELVLVLAFVSCSFKLLIHKYQYLPYHSTLCRN